MKRFLSILLAVVMVMSLAVPAFASRFSDIEDSDYANAIEHLAGLGVIAGYEDGTFKPEKVVTRAEMAKMLVVCLGLEAGASLLEGTSEFDDVPATHWATGYIAVAAQYGLIKGDGDGNFRPDDTVNISEAATMVLRALGYNRVVDKAGEWPTNYLNKSNELDIFEDVGAYKGTDGATRGIIAQMMWNMLDTRMWEVGSESEGGGLTYGQRDTMLETKFPKYTFVESMLFLDYDIEEDKNNNPEVELYFEEISEDGIGSELIYAGNDFYTFVPGTEFEGLVFEGKDGDEVVTLFATEDNNLVEGFVKDLVEDFDRFDDEYFGDYDYIYANMEGTKTSSGFKFEEGDDDLYDDDGDDSTFDSFLEYGAWDSWYVEDLEETKDGFTLIESTCDTEGMDTDYEFEFDEDDTYLVLKDGERVTREEIKVGDVLTFVHYNYEEEYDDVVIITRGNTAEGTVTKYVADTNMLTLGGEKYYVSRYATFIVDEEDEDSESDVWDDEENDFTDYKDEDARVYLDMFGNVIRVAFGELSEKVSNGALFVVAKNMWDVSDEEGSQTKIKLTDMNGETKTYTFDEDAEELEFANESYKNSVLWVEFDDDKIVDAEIIIEFNNNTRENPHPELPIDRMTEMREFYDGILAGEDAPTDEDEILRMNLDSVIYEDGKLNARKVTDSTKLVTLITDVAEDEDEETIYTVKIETGKDAFKGFDADALVFTSGEFNNVEYVFTCEDTTTSDLMYGLVDTAEYDEVNEEYTAVLKDENGKEVEYVTETILREGTIVAYVLNSKDKVVVKDTFTPQDYRGGAEILKVDANNKTAKLVNTDAIIDLEDEDVANKYEDYSVLTAKVGYEEDGKNFDGYYFTGFEVIDYEDIKLAEKDCIELNEKPDIIAIYTLTSVAYKTPVFGLGTAADEEIQYKIIKSYDSATATVTFKDDSVFTIVGFAKRINDVSHEQAWSYMFEGDILPYTIVEPGKIFVKDTAIGTGLRFHSEEVTDLDMSNRSGELTKSETRSFDLDDLQTRAKYQDYNVIVVTIEGWDISNLETISYDDIELNLGDKICVNPYSLYSNTIVIMRVANP